MCANDSVPRFDSATNSTPEPFDPYAALSDRELLALFVQTLGGCDFIYDIEAGIERNRNPELAIWQDEDYAALMVQYWLLKDALNSADLRVSAARTDAAGGEQ